MIIGRLTPALMAAAAVVPRSAAKSPGTFPWDGDRRHLEGDIAAVAHDLGADLDQSCDADFVNTDVGRELRHLAKRDAMESNSAGSQSEPNSEMMLTEFIEHKLPKDKGRYARVKFAILSDAMGGGAGPVITKDELRKLPIREVFAYERALMEVANIGSKSVSWLLQEIGKYLGVATLASYCETAFEQVQKLLPKLSDAQRRTLARQLQRWISTEETIDQQQSIDNRPDNDSVVG